MADELKKKFTLAAEIAKAVPKNLQEAAFNRALDELLGQASRAGRVKPGKPAKRAARGPVTNTAENGVVEQLLGLARTAYPKIKTAKRAIDRALVVLNAAHRNLQIDGLTAPQISQVLKDKFRLSVSRKAIQNALDGNHDFVDRAKTGRKVTYRIMEEGEQYVATQGWQSSGSEPASGKASSRTARTTKKKRKSQSKKGTTKTEKKQNPGSSAGKKKRSKHTKTSARATPMSALRDLVSDGFFEKERTILDIMNHLEKKRGHRFKANELSTPLLRLVRRKELDRDRLGEMGQYEYKAR